jgi:membrane associated rhomboid family serine protease
MTVDVPMKRLPIANWLLIAVTVIVSFVGFSYKPPIPPLPSDTTDPKQVEKFMQEVEKRKEYITPLALHPKQFHVWQLITHMFVHADLFHLAGNMIFLFCFGNAVDAKLGHLAFLGSYFVTGLLGALVMLPLSGGLPMLGASGAISGIVGIFLVLYPLNEIALWDLDYLWLSGGEPWRLSSYWFILFHFVFDLYGTVFMSKAGIAYACHLTGEIVGAAVTAILVYRGIIQPDRGEITLLHALGFFKKSPKRARQKPRKAKGPPHDNGR